MSAEMEKVSALYLKHERKMCRFYCALEDKVDAFASRIEAATLERGGEIPHPSLVFQDASNRQVVVAFMAFLVHIDALRSFALLNSIAVIKIGVQHCEQGVEKRVVEKLYEEPFYGCMRLSS